tara:strand:- start:670 stop:873 length:204 start_codon:yes stop_codon:yes gene_type:complete
LSDSQAVATDLEFKKLDLVDSQAHSNDHGAQLGMVSVQFTLTFLEGLTNMAFLQAFSISNEESNAYR